MHTIIQDALRAALYAAVPPIGPVTIDAILADTARRLAAAPPACPCGGGRVTIYMEDGQVVDVATDGPHELTIVDWDEHADWPDAIDGDGHPAPALQACIDALRTGRTGAES